MIEVSIGPGVATSTSKKYPYIGKWGSILVLFTAPRTGVCLSKAIGYFAANWSEGNYTPVSAPVTLTNI